MKLLDRVTKDTSFLMRLWLQHYVGGQTWRREGLRFTVEAIHSQHSLLLASALEGI